MIRRLVYPATDWLAALIAGEVDTVTPAGRLALEHFTSNEEPRTLCDNCVRRVSSEAADDGWPLCGLLVLTDAKSPTSARDAAFDVTAWRERVDSGWAPHPCSQFVPNREIEVEEHVDDSHGGPMECVCHMGHPPCSFCIEACVECRTLPEEDTELDDEGICEGCRASKHGPKDCDGCLASGCKGFDACEYESGHKTSLGIDVRWWRRRLRVGGPQAKKCPGLDGVPF